MAYRKMIAASAATVGGLALVAAIAAARVPAGTLLPTHSNAAGEADRFAEASTALFMPVLLALFLSLLMAAVPRVEPMQRRLERSAALYHTAWGSLLAMMAVIEAAVAAPAFGVALPATLPLAAVGMLLVVIGNALPKSRPGFFVGIRLPWTLMDEDNWVATHRLAARTTIAGGVAVVAAALLPLAAATREAVVIAAMVIVIVPPILYSYLHWQRRARRQA